MGMSWKKSDTQLRVTWIIKNFEYHVTSLLSDHYFIGSQRRLGMNANQTHQRLHSFKVGAAAIWWTIWLLITSLEENLLFDSKRWVSQNDGQIVGTDWQQFFVRTLPWAMDLQVICKILERSCQKLVAKCCQEVAESHGYLVVVLPMQNIILIRTNFEQDEVSRSIFAEYPSLNSKISPVSCISSQPG